ncbi:Metallo-dependent phosphatase-like protein [Dimargaris cristalligena]|uniref:Metallo-dependent phosphatase-like protein n=1 Tax=Dimargaris cristalligena TaxID=215637 RepID=A0A4V1J464_9FUNG|nr:Metallo-dependent phosphatase-like protein [Dimargaris cristalligena]|eukprot:RKP34469.1 Metallo-dependent phosphatase-like protein [Dimargaris cristalligena]
MTGPIGSHIPYNSSPASAINSGSGSNLQLRVIFTNDIHGREDEFNRFGTDCVPDDYQNQTCYGGVARMKTVFDSLRSGFKNTLLFDAGDQFQGTMFYSHFKGNSTARFMNALGYDGMAIGNHEFDDGPSHLARFFAQLNFPVVCSNLDLTEAPDLDRWVKPYVLFPEYELAIVGFVTVTTQFISNPGRTVKFLDPAESVQKYIDLLRAKGYKRFIALSHNGYKQDQALAERTEGLAMIVGGHSHTYLSTDHPNDPDSKGPYPTKVLNQGGRYTYIVQAKKFGEYIGYIDMELTSDGDMAWLAGQPIHMTTAIPKDPYFSRQVSQWRESFDRIGGFSIGELEVDLPQEPCKVGECLLGNMVTDAMLEVGQFYKPQIALMNSDGMRSGMRKGNVTINRLINVLPNDSYLVHLNMTGKEIRDTLVGAVNEIHPVDQKPVTVFIQFAGLKMEFNFQAKTIKSISVRASPAPSSSSGSQSTNDPAANGDSQWVPLDDAATYSVISTDFITKGGDHLFDKPRPATNITKMYNMLYEYAKIRPQLRPQLDQRMVSV